MRKVLFLPIEIIERELDGKLLVAAEALRRNFHVYIGHYREIEQFAFAEGNGVYLYKAMTDYNAKSLFLPLKNSGVIPIALDEEGLVWPSIEYYAKTRLGEGQGLHSLEKIFTWGKEQKDFICNNYNISCEKVIVTGNPRFDILSEPFSRIYDKEVSKIRLNYKKYVLINTNFGPANFSHVFGRTWLEHMHWSGIIKNDLDLFYFTERQNYYAQIIEEYASAIRLLAPSIFPLDIIIRPHPSEEHTTWSSRFRDIPNVHVVYHGSSKPWIKGAVCVIHTGCTTGLEAFYMNVPVIRYNTIDRNDMESPLPNHVSIFCRDYKSLEKNVLKFSNDHSIVKHTEELAGLLGSRLQNAYGTLSYQIIVDSIENILSQAKHSRNHNTEPLIPGTYKFILNDTLQFLLNGLIRVSFIRNLKIFNKLRLRHQRFSGLPLKKVTSRMNMIIGNSSGNLEAGYVAVRVGRNVIRFAPK